VLSITREKRTMMTRILTEHVARHRLAWSVGLGALAGAFIGTALWMWMFS